MLFHTGDAIFKDDNSPIHTARSVQSLFEQQEDALQHSPWPAQLPEVNIIKPLWSVLQWGEKQNMFFMKSEQHSTRE
jgi:hypothetical protein